jgi:hypothetical protein
MPTKILPVSLAIVLGLAASAGTAKAQLYNNPYQQQRDFDRQNDQIMRQIERNNDAMQHQRERQQDQMDRWQQNNRDQIWRNQHND